MDTLNILERIYSELEDESKLSIVSKNYKIIESKYIYFKDYIIGSGSFGKVYYGMNINRKIEYAIKFEKSSIKNSVLFHELKVYSDLQGGLGIPQIYWSGKYKDCKIMIMDLLGPSLDKFYKINNKKLNLETTINLGQQMIRRIEYLHSKNYIHRDIKPNNFLLGKYNRKFNSNLVYMIDFGLSKEYYNPISKQHSIFKENRRFVGTPRYASINAHIGVKQSRRDDLESIAYVLIYYIKSELPWQGIKAKTKSEKKEKIKSCKINSDFFKLCEDIPKEFVDFLQYTKSLDYYEKPNYDYLIFLLESVKIDNNYCVNFKYIFWEWNDFFLTAKNLEKTKDEYILIKEIFNKLYEGYPIQDFEEFILCLEDFKIDCDIYNSKNLQLDLEKNKKFLDYEIDNKLILNNNKIIQKEEQEKNFDFQLNNNYFKLDCSDMNNIFQQNKNFNLKLLNNKNLLKEK